MARQTRQQRRDRRAASNPDGGAVAASRPAGRQKPPPRPAAPAADGAERRAPGSGLVRFVGESIGELKKVEWPGQHQVVTGTTVVLIACVIVGVFLYANDIVWKHVVQNFLLGK